MSWQGEILQGGLNKLPVRKGCIIMDRFEPEFRSRGWGNSLGEHIGCSGWGTHRNSLQYLLSPRHLQDIPVIVSRKHWDVSQVPGDTLAGDTD